MASRTHAPGQGQVLQQIGKAGLPAILASFNQQTQDIRNMVQVIGPTGFPGWVYVKGICNDQIYKVQSLNGQSYAPGTMVLLGNQGGGFGAEFIIGAAPGQAGGSDVSVSTSVTFGVFNVTPPPIPPPPPPPVISNAYLAIADDGTFLYAYWYNSDGTYGSRRAKISYSGVFDPPTAFPHGAPAIGDNILAAIYVPSLADTVLLRVLDPTSHLSAVVTWTIPGSFTLCEPYFAAGHRLTNFSGPGYRAGVFLVGGPGNLSGGPPYQIYSGAVGQVGAFIATPVGPNAGFTGSGLAAGPGKVWARDNGGNDWALDVSALSWGSSFADSPGIGFIGAGATGAVVLVGASEVAVALVASGLVPMARGASGAPFQALPSTWLSGDPVCLKNSPDNSRLIAFPLRSPSDASKIYFYDGPISPLPTGSPTLLQPPASGDGPFPQLLLARS